MKDVTIPEGLSEGDTFVHEGMRFTLKKGDLTVKDMDLGAYLYVTEKDDPDTARRKAAKARYLITQHAEDLGQFGPFHSVSEMVELGSNAERKVTAHYLTQGPLFYIVPKTRTPKGKELSILMTHVFIAWTNGKLVSANEVPRLSGRPHQPAIAPPARGFDIDRTTSFKGMIFSEFGADMHVLDGSLAIALGMTVAQFETHLATRPFIDALGERPLALGGTGRFLNRNHVDFAVDGLPLDEDARKRMLKIQHVMHAREKGHASIVHGRLVWAYKTEKQDDISHKLLERILRQSETAPWTAIDMLADAKGTLRARHSHIAIYLGVAEAEIREAIASARSTLEQTETVIDRIENRHGHTVIGHYLTVEQACAVAEVVGSPPKRGSEPFETYFAFKKEADRIVDDIEAKRDALEKHQAETVMEDGSAPKPLPTLRSRLMTRLKGFRS